MTVAGDDPIYSFSPEEKKRVTENLLLVARDIHAGRYSQHRMSVSLLRDVHARIFEGVRDHAGRIRTAAWGSERLVFGPNRSAHRNEVEARLERVFRRVTEQVRALEQDPNNPLYAEVAFSLAVHSHADVIHIHPFQDGNGRTSRALLNILLVRLGLRPIAVEQCKQEYVALLNTYFESRDIQPLVDGLLRIGVEQLSEARDSGASRHGA